MRESDNPDLLFNGACKSEDYFESSTAGDDFSLIADLGADVSLEEVSAQRAFSPTRMMKFGGYSKFVQKVKVLPNHVYAVLLNTSEKRGLFVFKVIEYVQNEKVVLQYAVKSYQINGRIRAEGFDWTKSNQ